MTPIDDVDAWEVLDSRGNPTVRVRVRAGDATGTFSVPSGASTGTHEAVERRDGDDRYGGAGVKGAVESVIGPLAEAVIGMDPRAQADVDATLVEADGTPGFSRFGANAVLGVSGAVAHAGAVVSKSPLYQHLVPDTPGSLPLPMVNLVSGGLHASGGMAVQDVLAIPVGADTFTQALEMTHAVRTTLCSQVQAAGHRPLVADEGGLAPPLEDPKAAFELVLDAIRSAGYGTGSDGVAIGVDVAATHFYGDGGYRLTERGPKLDTESMVEHVLSWIDEYPICSIEDPLAENDWDGWQLLSSRLRGRVQLLGDDLLVTNGDRIDRAAENGAANAALIKPNQAGTLTRAVEAAQRAQAAGWNVVISARSGETCDTTIADLAVALDAGQIKIGSLARSERLAKYNRLLEIDREYDGEFVGEAPLAFTQ